MRIIFQRKNKSYSLHLLLCDRDHVLEQAAAVLASLPACMYACVCMFLFHQHAAVLMHHFLTKS